MSAPIPQKRDIQWADVFHPVVEWTPTDHRAYEELLAFSF